MVDLKTIHIKDTQYLQQQGTLAGKTALVNKINNADAFSKTLQQVQAKAATKTVSATTADMNTDALKQPLELIPSPTFLWVGIDTVFILLVFYLDEINLTYSSIGFQWHDHYQ